MSEPANPEAESIEVMGLEDGESGKWLLKGYEVSFKSGNNSKTR